DGSFTYTPATDYLGPDAFTYKANDGHLDSNVATVRLEARTVVLPPMSAGDSYQTTIGQTLVVAPPGVLGNDVDPAGGRLTAPLMSPPRHGALSLGADGSFTYTPNSGFSGVDGFQYVASNGLAVSNAGTVTIRVIDPNGPPAVTAQPLVTQEGAALSGVVV